MTDIYISLRYEDYKELERQLSNYAAMETTHYTMASDFYHRAFRLKVGDITFEFQGPLVKAPQKVDNP